MQLGIPVHLIVGELDSRFVALARQIKEQIGAAKLTIVPGAGHNVLLERPSAIIHALLEPALDASGAAGAKA
jgi:2-succinyl-6-hydroxy-2,4-cyclohexadiene-1-carboxylate synthase